MAKMKLAENTFTIIPEGTTIFKVMEVDESKYDDYGKLKVTLQTSSGEKQFENFSLFLSTSYYPLYSQYLTGYHVGRMSE